MDQPLDALDARGLIKATTVKVATVEVADQCLANHVGLRKLVLVDPRHQTLEGFVVETHVGLMWKRDFHSHEHTGRKGVKLCILKVCIRWAIGAPRGCPGIRVIQIGDLRPLRLNA